MKFKSNVSYRQTEGGLIFLYNKLDGTLFELNETGTAIVKIIEQGNATIDSITDALLEIYDANREVIQEEVTSLIDEFFEFDIIEKDNLN